MLKREIFANKYFVFLILFYFIFRFINLTNFPIFNDEAIYLDWGWREISSPGNLYYSLYDAKPPLLMWIFGVFEKIFRDPLFAGRFVSVIAGFFVMLGIYKISKKLFDTKTALLSSFTYILIPLFSFYDGQALMESSISAVGIWTGYFILNILEKKYYKYAIFLGLILGIGFFIKSSALVFLISFLISVIYLVKLFPKKIKILEITFLTLFVFLCTVLLLIINPQFWSTLHTNARFTLTLSEFFSLPINTWIVSFITNLKISFFYLTPLLFISSIVGSIYIFNKNSMHKLLLLYFFVSFLIATLSVRGSSDRYVISFLPFLVICSSYILVEIFNKNKLKGCIVFFVILILPFLLTLYQIINFPGYILTMGKVSGYSHATYLNGFTSGYGVNEAVNYLKEISEKEKIIIGIAQNTGNPESAMLVMFAKSKNVKVAYLDSKLFPINVNDYNCLKVPVTTYFVSRDNQQAGLEKFFEKIKIIKNPYGINTIGIYKLKTDCKGKSFEVSAKKNSI